MKKFYAILFFAFLVFVSCQTQAQTYHNLAQGPFRQDWSDTSMFPANNIWTNVTSIIGYRGDNLTNSTGASPDTILADGSGSPLNVTRNYKNSTPNTGGIGEFEILNPTIGLLGSGTADAPHIVIFVNTTGVNTVRVKYKLRDIDGTTDTATQMYALQYKVGDATQYTNIPAGYVADATSGPQDSSKVTDINVILPSECNNKERVQIRIMTTNALGADEWVGIDDIEVLDDASTNVSNFQLNPEDFKITSLPNSDGKYWLYLNKSFNSELSLQILDISGKLLTQKRLVRPTQGQSEMLDLDIYGSGTYIIRLQSKEGVYTTRLIK
jgi:hypothetical protein